MIIMEKTQKIRKKMTLRDMFATTRWRIAQQSNPLSACDPGSDTRGTSNPDIAFCSIAIGVDYLKMSLQMIESLRRNGEFQGTMYVFTDNPAFFRGCENLIPITIPTPRSLMATYQYKTFINHVIPNESIVFIDADIVIGRPISKWLDEARKKTLDHSLVLFWDHGSKGHFYHSGLFMVNRMTGNSMLRRWRRRIWFFGHGRDQKALIKTVRKENDVYVMPAEDMLFLSATSADIQQVALFNHITRRARKVLPPEKINAFAEKLSLKRFY